MAAHDEAEAGAAPGATPAYDELLVRHDGATSWIYLNRPDAMNAMTMRTVRELRHAFDALGVRPQTRVVVLSGVGRAFCAGADLKSELPASGAAPAGAPSFLEEATAMEKALTGITKPVIAAVNGICCAGGLELALMCDFIVASEAARIGDAHANYGAMPGGGTTARLARVVGPNLAKYIFFTGKLLPAALLHQAGMVPLVLPAAELESGVQALAEGIAAKSPLGLRHMKALIDGAFDHPLASAVRLEKLVSTLYMQSHDAQEGGRAFAEKRQPHFEGY